ncbi:unnamed protein product [Larinioides sclopetarius]|uniref:Uncharacterized protein n=1 Tax=Larinioides sclopetarius TaxID=280406 RepID=A0AAV2B4D0_9ARAC
MNRVLVSKKIIAGKKVRWIPSLLVETVVLAPTQHIRMDNFLDKAFEFVPQNESESMNFSAVNDSLYEDGIQFYYFYQPADSDPSVKSFRDPSVKSFSNPSVKISDPSVK